MGITGVRNFAKASEPTTIEDVLNHFDHVRKLIGPEHLGVGSDMDLDGEDDLPPEERKQAAGCARRQGSQVSRSATGWTSTASIIRSACSI